MFIILIRLISTNKMDLKLFTLQFLLMCVASSSVLDLQEFPWPCNFPAIFNFGDSNSDTGGLAAAFGQLPPPYGETHFHAPAGRFSDGRLMIDFMSASLGFPYLSPYLQSIGSNFNNGANFASAAATIRPQNMTFLQSGFSPFYLNVQQIQYSNFVQKIAGEQEKDYFSRALYTLDIFQNDLTAAVGLNLNLDEILPDILQQFSDVIKKLYGLGGRTFWIHNTGPFGCLPLFLSLLPESETRFDEYGCFYPYNDMAHDSNLKLKELVLQLRNELPLAAITYVDIYSAKYALISQANNLGFEKPLAACCGNGGGEYNVEGGISCGKPQGSSCEDPSVRINWDGVHYTEAANNWVFKQIVDGSLSDPPLPLKYACNSYISPPPSSSSSSPLRRLPNNGDDICNDGVGL